MSDDCHADSGCCGGSGRISRRALLKSAGAGLAAVSGLAPAGPLMAGPFERAAGRPDHFVPADKRLASAWIQSLYEPGGPRLCRGPELNLIGMPVGGVAAGQVYLCGDGTLGCWQIFNQTYFSGYGADNYRPRMPDRPIAQGFAVFVESSDRTRARPLDRQGFPDVTFLGEHPLGRVRYADPDFPVRIELEAFSPFIPLNARDSAMPVTLLRFTLENTSAAALQAGLLGWLANAVLHHSAPRHNLAVEYVSRVLREPDRTVLLHAAVPPPGTAPPRDDIVLADFEAANYGTWEAEGEALGSGPVSGTLPNQSPVTGFLGRGLVNTYRGGDDAQGRLRSPVFELTRPYLSFLIGGGKHAGQTCLNLLVDGKVVRTAAGENRETLSWTTWDVRDLAGQQARLEIVDARTGPWGHVNVDQIVLSDRQRIGATGELAQLEDFGTLALALDGPAASADDAAALLARLEGLPENLACADELRFPADKRRTPTLAAPAVELAPGQRRTFTFAIGWHFPNRAQGNRYATWFDDAAAAVRHALANQERLAGQTRLWHDTYYDSSLPRWLLDRLHYPVSNLATGTCQWWANGRFWAWEGVGCCHGTCTHVWNYAHALARLFPELERSAREMQDLGVALHPDGRVGFRGEQNNAYAADGQAGTVLKCYREHRMSADSAFLQRNWPKIRQVLEFSIRQDGNEDGLIENTQHNTYDINFEGANTFVGALYLAALRAGEEMAREMDESDLAARLHRIFESGRQRTLEKLWNGEYFIQDVDFRRHPRDQYGTGCLADQLFGQGWAHQVGLGYLYPAEHVRSALESIWKYNWAPDIGPHNAAHPPERWFASPGEGGLFTCTWPHGQHLDEGVRYRDEVWTGTEYQVAGHMIWEGLVEPALAILRAVHERYDPRRHNPYNDVECGDHYARALASWGVYLALCGYDYHGPRGELSFAPRLSPEDFRCAFTAAEGWGAFAQQRTATAQRCQVALRWGRLRLTALRLAVPAALAAAPVRATAGGRERAVSATAEPGHVRLRFADELILQAGEVLEVAIGA